MTEGIYEPKDNLGKILIKYMNESKEALEFVGSMFNKGKDFDYMNESRYATLLFGYKKLVSSHALMRMVGENYANLPESFQKTVSSLETTLGEIEKMLIDIRFHGSMD
ncbi:MAG: hypothetical protein Q7S27_06275 [Nanoarchaeota archaeon]|nr:hypothetical protein [Nanoarchaeota archaeon]